MGTEINVTFVRDSNGAIDVNGTLADWSKALAEYASKESADLETIAQAVERVWADFQGKSMNLDAIASFTMRHLPAVDPSAHAVVNERIKDYVRSATSKFALTKGKGGGVIKLDRCTPEELTKVNAQREKAAQKAAAKAA